MTETIIILSIICVALAGALVAVVVRNASRDRDDECEFPSDDPDEGGQGKRR